MEKVYVIEGSHKKRQEALDNIKKSLDSYDLIRIDEKDEVVDVSHRILEMGCFRDQLFIFDAFPSLKTPSKDKAKDDAKIRSILQDIIPRIPLGNIVVFYNIGIISKKFLDVIKKEGKIITSETKVLSSQATDYIIKYFEKKDQMIEREFAKMIPDALSGYYDDKVDVDLLRLNIAKLEMITGEKKVIKKDDVFTVCIDISKEFISWQLYDLLDKQDFYGALELSKRYLFDNSKNIIGDLLFNLNGLLWRYRLILMVRDTIASGTTKKEDIISKLSNLKKIELNKSNKKVEGEKEPLYSEKAIYNILKQGDNTPLKYNIKHLNIIVHALMKAIIKIRIGCSESELDIIFEFLLMIICGKIRKSSMLSILDSRKRYIIDKEYS